MENPAHHPISGHNFRCPQTAAVGDRDDYNNITLELMRINGVVIIVLNVSCRWRSSGADDQTEHLCTGTRMALA